MARFFCAVLPNRQSTTIISAHSDGVVCWLNATATTATTEITATRENRIMKRKLPGLITALAVLAVLPHHAMAEVDGADMQTGDKHWRAQKCAVYQDVRAELLDTIPRGALSPEFAKAEEDYIENGCAGRAYACPKSKTELDYANEMSLAMMSHGLTGTFLPYGCKSGIQ